MDKKTIKAKELQRKALEFRTLGLSYQQIGDQLGVTKGAARNIPTRKKHLKFG